MTYRILELVDSRKDGQSLYRFKTQNIDNEVQFVEFEDLQKVDKYVEDLLNQGVPKTNIVVVSVQDYKVSADIAENE